MAGAISDRYEADRTFSVPILSMLALAGKLGQSPEAWRHVKQLPFELAACPHRWFKWLRLPVVSYALPALIAIGFSRHTRLAGRCPVAKLIRNLAASRTLRVLEEIQPTGGGFLEAAPLTSFVVMNLCGIAAGDASAQKVIHRGTEFLISNVLPDGSWPIDTNLATWTTTLSVNALSAGGELEKYLDEGSRNEILDWLLTQQGKTEHPYTHAEPGGWAWSNLSGAVPDADDTAGAVLALHCLAPSEQRVRLAAMAGIQWLIDLQNRDGGMPTFCRGWGKLPFDRSGADLTAHAILAMTTWKDDLPPALAGRVDKFIRRGIEYLRGVQRPDGSWLPLWFGNQHAPGEENPVYGTARVLLALAQVIELPNVSPMFAKGLAWLMNAQNSDGGWGGKSASGPSSIEETAVTVDALVKAGMNSICLTTINKEHIHSRIERGVQWLIDHSAGGKEFPAAPIGLYFARLWYFERLYPLVFTVSALERVKRCCETR